MSIDYDVPKVQDEINRILAKEPGLSLESVSEKIRTDGRFKRSTVLLALSLKYHSSHSPQEIADGLGKVWPR